MSLIASDQFSCSICLEQLQDPVTVPCGHSYCISCLTSYWDNQDVCLCPQCKASFSPRPTLGRNNLLVEMMQKLGAVAMSDVPSAPPLYEDRHSFQHATFDVSSVRPERTDAERRLGETRRRLTEQINEKEAELQQLKQTLWSFSRLAKQAVKDTSRIFSELLEFLECRRVEMKELIRAQEKAEVTRVENQLRRLEQHVSELKKRDAELERMSHARSQHLPPPTSEMLVGQSSSLVLTSHISFGGVRSATSDLKEALQQVYHKHFPDIATAVRCVNVLQPQKMSKEESCNSRCVPALDDRNDLLQYFCPLSLDPFTAHREILLRDGNRAASRTEELQPYPDHPERFDSWVQVLCREGLVGRRYWEVEWDGQQVALGITYNSIQRKGSSNGSRLGYNALSWSLRCSASAIVFIHGGEEQVVPVSSCPPTPRRIGFYLDHNVGLLCFYAVTPGGVCLLQRVTTSFTQPLHPAAWLGAGSTVNFCCVD